MKKTLLNERMKTRKFGNGDKGKKGKKKKEMYMNLRELKI